MISFLRKQGLQVCIKLVKLNINTIFICFHKILVHFTKTQSNLRKKTLIKHSHFDKNVAFLKKIIKSYIQLKLSAIVYFMINSLS